MREYQSSEVQQRPTLEYQGRILPALPRPYVDRIVEPNSSSHDLLPWGAVPANPYMNDAVKQQQADEKAFMRYLYASPPDDQPADFSEMVADDYMINEERRAMKNYDSFMSWSESNIPPEHLAEQVYLFSAGKANTGQIFDIALGTDLDTFEAQKLTHPGGYRMYHLYAMRSEAEEAVLDRGGVVYPAELLLYRDFDVVPKVASDGKLVGFIVRYKRDYGHMFTPDGKKIINLVERQIAGFRVDEASGFDQSLVRAFEDISRSTASEYSGVYNEDPRVEHLSKVTIKQFMQLTEKEVDPKVAQGLDAVATYGNQSINWSSPKDLAVQSILKRLGIYDYITTAIQTNSLAAYIKPQSTMLYGFKEDVATSKIAQRLKGRTVDQEALDQLLARLG